MPDKPQIVIKMSPQVAAAVARALSRPLPYQESRYTNQVLEDIGEQFEKLPKPDDIDPPSGATGGTFTPNNGNGQAH